MDRQGVAPKSKLSNFLLHYVHLHLCRLCLDLAQKAVLHVVKDGVVIHDRQVLCLGLELLVGVLAGTAHHRVGHLLLLHLLVELAGGCGLVSIDFAS